MPYYLNNFYGLHLPPVPEPKLAHHVPHLPDPMPHQPDPVHHQPDPLPHQPDPMPHQPDPLPLQDDAHIDSNISHSGPVTRSRARKKI